MKITETHLEGLVVIEPDIFGDKRGLFLESWQDKRFKKAGINTDFVQDNLSRSVKNVLRGMHFQKSNGQAQLVYVSHGEIFDVAVDLRKNSPTFGKYFSAVLNGDNLKQVYMPSGFAHGFCVLSEVANIHYKVTEYYNPADEGGLLWNDETVAIEWPVANPVIKERDANFPKLKEIKELPEG